MTPSVVETPAGSNAALQTMRQLFPQGWSFFTRDAREETYSAYTQVDGVWTLVSPISGSSPRFGFGVNRGARLVDGDIARIAVATPSSGSLDDAWTACDPGETVGDCVRRNDVQSDATQTLNPLIQDTCGEVLIAKVEPIPWSYGKLTRAYRQGIRIVTTECSS
jgi:antimicrobial peptide system SdpA family protein